jgi:hypothetical protein
MFQWGAKLVGLPSRDAGKLTGLLAACSGFVDAQAIESRAGAQLASAPRGIGFSAQPCVSRE